MFNPFKKQNAANHPAQTPENYQSYQNTTAQLHDNISQSKNTSTSELLRDYKRDREFILQGIRDYINAGDIDSAKELVDRYRNVANDEPFINLMHNADDRYQKKQKINKLIESYNYTTNDQRKERLNLCTEILSLDPDNSQFKDNLIKELEGIYDRLDKNDLERRLTIYTELARIEPRKYEKERVRLEKKYKKSLIQERKTVPAVKKNKRSLYIGSSVWSHPALSGKYSPAHNDFSSPVKAGNVTLKIHTHGISISPAHAGTFQIHYTCIRAMDKVPSNGIVGMVKGIIGALGNALLGTPNSSYIRIAYHDPIKDQNKTITIQTDSAEKTNAFIDNFRNEIEITKRTGRKASPLMNILAALGKFFLILLIILTFIALLIAFVLFVLPTAQ